MAHDELSQVADFIRAAGATGRAKGQHLAVAFSAGPVEFVVGQRRNDDARADGIDRRSAMAPAGGFIHDAQDVAALGILICLQGIRDFSEKRKVQQLFCRRRGQLLIFLRRQRSQAMAGLR